MCHVILVGQVEFPNANVAYTYLNLLKAFAKFPMVCTTELDCRRTLATMFAHFQQETAGGRFTAALRHVQ
jgi:hypothetical protein